MCHIWPKSGLTCTWERQCRGGQGRCSALSSSGLPLMFLHPTCMRDGLQAHCVIVTGSLFSTVPTLPGMSASRSRHHREGAFPMASAGTWESHTDSGSPKHPLPRSACYFRQAPSRSRELIFVQGAGPAAPGPSRGGVPGNGARGADRPRPPCPHGAPLRVPSAAGAPARAYGRGAEGSERRGGARCGGGRWQSWLRFRGSASASGVPLPLPGPRFRFRGPASGAPLPGAQCVWGHTQRRGSHTAASCEPALAVVTSPRAAAACRGGGGEASSALSDGCGCSPGFVLKIETSRPRRPREKTAEAALSPLTVPVTSSLQTYEAAWLLGLRSCVKTAKIKRLRAGRTRGLVALRSVNTHPGVPPCSEASD